MPVVGKLEALLVAGVMRRKRGVQIEEGDLKLGGDLGGERVQLCDLVAFERLAGVDGIAHAIHRQHRLEAVLGCQPLHLREHVARGAAVAGVISDFARVHRRGDELRCKVFLSAPPIPADQALEARIGVGLVVEVAKGVEGAQTVGQPGLEVGRRDLEGLARRIKAELEKARGGARLRKR